MPTDPFQQWLDEMVLANNGSISTRKKSIYDFVYKGLVPWLNAQGYVIGTSMNDFKNCIATGLYNNKDLSHMASEWKYYYDFINDEYSQEEKDHYHHIVDDNSWAHFWNWWGGYSDFNLNTFRGIDRRLDIQAFVWDHLDLSKSPQTEILNELLADDNELDSHDYHARQTSRAIDTYLHDASEFGGYGGIRK